MRAPILSAVLLAAGLGRRFGGNKLLYPVEGEPLYLHTFEAIPPEMFRRAAVVSGYGEILTVARSRGYLPVSNPHPLEGQSLSVKLGLQAVEEGADGVLFAVCDQPWLRRESVEKLVAAWTEEPHRIFALSAQGRRGNPVIFPARFFPELAALTGDVGGGAVLKKHPEELRLVEAGSARELEDMDTRQ